MSNTAAVGYARRSTEMQERSIPDQQAYVEQWAAEHGYTIVKWFLDDAVSGTGTRGRDAFAQMIAAAENGRDFDAVLCYDMSRFSRGGTNETGYYLHRLKMAGVEAVFPAEGIPEGDEGELLQGVKSWQARQYSVKLSRDSIRGLISTITIRHSTPGGVPPFGYDKQHLTSDGRVLRTFRWLPDGQKEEYDPAGKLVRILPAGETVKKAKSDIVRYVPSTPDRVAVVRRIFDIIAAGFGARHVAGRLNDDGVPSSDGQMWGKGQVRKIVANPVYRGALVWNKVTGGKLHGVGRDGKLRPRKGVYWQRYNPRPDWYVIDDVHEPLVSKELFEKVQQLQDSRRHMGGRAKTGSRALLSGLMVCKECKFHFGQYVAPQTLADGQVRRYRYYVDRGYHTGGKAVCRGTFIPADALEAWVIGKVKAAILGEHRNLPEAVESFIHQVLAGQDRPAETTGVEKELEAVTKRIKAMVAMLADPSFEGLEELKVSLAILTAKRDGLQKALEGSRKANVHWTESDLRPWADARLERIDKLLNHQATSTEARELVHSVVDRIEIDPVAKIGTLYIPQGTYWALIGGLRTLGNLSDTSRTPKGHPKDTSGTLRGHLADTSPSPALPGVNRESKFVNRSGPIYFHLSTHSSLDAAASRRASRHSY